MTTTIKDVIHGFIVVPPLCQAFIDTVEFNRLRHIKQLGLASYVYPAATHTRFEHSLGVMHLAGKMCDVLGVRDRNKDLIQLAGLYHDIGHVACSHLFDYILQEQNAILPHLLRHEDRSAYILAMVNNRLGLLSPQEVQFVGRVINGEPMPGYPTFYFEIVSSKKAIDVDRLDYTQRDLYHIGMSCFQSDYVIQNLRVVNDTIGVAEKARLEVEMMFEARRRILLLICRHRTVVKAEKLIRKAIADMNLIGAWFEQNWMRLTDNLFQVMLEERCPSLYEKLCCRHWGDIDPEEQRKHLSIVDRAEISRAMESVTWFEE